MSTIDLSEAEARQLESESLNDIYASLALTDAGTAKSAGVAISSVASIKTIVRAEEATTENIFDWLAARGKALFEKYWPAVKEEICRLYTGEDPANVKEWIERAAVVILGVLNITAAAAVFVAVLALRMGLNRLCKAA